MRHNIRKKMVWIAFLNLALYIIIVNCDENSQEKSITASIPGTQIESSDLPSTPTPTDLPTLPLGQTPTPAGSQTSPPASKDPIVIAAIGDSITFGLKSNVGGYPSMLESKLRNAGYNVRVQNMGVPGARAEETDNNFVHFTYDADVTLIMIGTNNMIDMAGCPAPQYCNVISSIQSMVEKARKRGIRTLISTIPPLQSTSVYSWANPHIQSLNAQISSEIRSTIVDNYTAILSQGGDALFIDSAHFTDQGYGVIAQEWYKALVTGNILK